MSASRATPSTSLEKLKEESVAQVLLVASVASEEVLIELENPACPGSPSVPFCRRDGISA